MPIATPFFPRVESLCTSRLFKDWAGYFAVRSYETHHEGEYYAFRHSAGMIDVTPLFKYDVSGPDAGRFLGRLMARNVNRMKVGQVYYLCWCDEGGNVIDDGTVSRIEDDYYRVTSADPSLHWFIRHVRGLDVTVRDVTATIGALSVQGPRARDIVDDATGGAVASLRFFHLTRARVGSADVVVTRTGYTGDLGFEVWVGAGDALDVWDALMESGRPHAMMPCGLDAMDVTRIEAGFILNGVDYFSSLHAMIPARKSSPFELGLGWSVHLKGRSFIGSAALREEKRNGSRRAFVGLEYDWDETEALFREHGLPPEVPSGAWRDGRPVYDTSGRFVGQATSGAWSPLLKRALALATVDARYAREGTRLRIEVTVEYERRTVTATVVPRPFFDPERKRA